MLIILFCRFTDLPIALMMVNKVIAQDFLGYDDMICIQQCVKLTNMEFLVNDFCREIVESRLDANTPLPPSV